MNLQIGRYFSVSIKQMKVKRYRRREGDEWHLWHSRLSADGGAGKRGRMWFELVANQARGQRQWKQGR